MKSLMTLIVFSLLAALLLASAALAREAAVTPAVAINQLNALRAANGLPANIESSPSDAAACHLHNLYAQTNGWDANPHSETPGKPGYSDAGLKAARQAVLAQGISGWPVGSPWANAPFHLAGLLYPQLQRVGFDESGDYTCMTVTDQRSTVISNQNRVFSFPADGHTGVPYMQRVCDEWPVSPSESLGLGNCVKTGPNLIIFADGPFIHIADGWFAFDLTKSSLVEADNPAVSIELRHTPVDDTELSSIIVPVTPLRPNTRYRLSVTVTANARLVGDPNGVPVAVPYSSTFTTGSNVLDDRAGSAGGSTGGSGSGGSGGARPQAPITITESFAGALLDRHDNWSASANHAASLRLNYSFSRRSAAALVLYRHGVVLGRASFAARRSGSVSIGTLAHGKKLTGGSYTVLVVALADGSRSSRSLLLH